MRTKIIIARVATVLGLLVATIVVLVAIYAARIAFAVRDGAAPPATDVGALPLHWPVTIARDGFGIPHITARDDHDLYFGQGYAFATDRLFQLELERRYVEGRLAEWMGSAVVPVDREMRRYDIAHFAKSAYDAASPAERTALAAFADGVNAAIVREPAPPEFRALLTSMPRWEPQDGLAVAFATVLDLVDGPEDLQVRDAVYRALGPVGYAAFYPLSDPRYDAPTTSSRAATSVAFHTAAPDDRQRTHMPDLPGTRSLGTFAAIEERPPVGSNEWALGAARVTGGHAVLANDPHLRAGVPAVWWVCDLHSPTQHVAGATLAGSPGVILGHNERVAWGATDAQTVAMRLFREPVRGIDEINEGGTWVRAAHRSETIHVRFGPDVTEDVLETPRGIVVARERDSVLILDWPTLLKHAVSPLGAFLLLDRATDARGAIEAMRAFPGPPHNFAYVDVDGNAAYHIGGRVPIDPFWGSHAHDAGEPLAEPADVPYESLPQVPPARDAVAFTANNKVYPDGYPYRLAAWFAAPYRAFEIHARLTEALRRGGGRTDVATAAAIQSDVHAIPELVIAQDALAAAGRRGSDPAIAPLAPLLDALHEFNGEMRPDSRGASVATRLRLVAVRMLAGYHLPADLADKYVSRAPGSVVLVRALRDRPRGWVPGDDWDAFLIDALGRTRTQLGAGPVPPFSQYGAMTLRHPLAAFGFTFWNGPTYDGHGGQMSPAVQWNNHSQSFRATWVAGDWDNSTLDLPGGESGRPGTPHYADRTGAWASFARTPFPFSQNAVDAATVSRQTLHP